MGLLQLSKAKTRPACIGCCRCLVALDPQWAALAVDPVVDGSIGCVDPACRKPPAVVPNRRRTKQAKQRSSNPTLPHDDHLFPYNFQDPRHHHHHHPNDGCPAPLRGRRRGRDQQPARALRRARRAAPPPRGEAVSDTWRGVPVCMCAYDMPVESNRSMPEPPDMGWIESQFLI